MGVVPKGHVELRSIPERPVNQVGGLGSVQRVEIGLERLEHGLWWRVDGAENCLTADYDELLEVCDLCRCREQVLELVNTQLDDLLHDPAALRLAE